VLSSQFSVLSSQFSVLSSQFGSYSVRIAKSLSIYITPIFSKNSAVFAGFSCKNLRFFCYVKKSHIAHF
ncbi:hypothetical protein, partial [uncultured Treponema sp.]|uniref:hypothetical protein n=1 Tax=uncultured Treponema sp. TaxID=162155 RepID=UPI0025EFF275